VPALHKGWLDRVMSYYFAYGGPNNLKGKKWMCSVTTGGPETAYSKEGFWENKLEEILKHFN